MNRASRAREQNMSCAPTLDLTIHYSRSYTNTSHFKVSQGYLQLVFESVTVRSKANVDRVELSGRDAPPPSRLSKRRIALSCSSTGLAANLLLAIFPIDVGRANCASTSLERRESRKPFAVYIRPPRSRDHAKIAALCSLGRQTYDYTYFAKLPTLALDFFTSS